MKKTVEYSNEELRNICKEIRKDLLSMTFRAGSTGAHIGGALSLVEIMAVLYLKKASINPQLLTSEARDRIILSKGHGAMAQYAAMYRAGLLSEGDIMSFKTDGSALSAHPSKNPRIGIEYSSGSLGQGLSLGVGSCLALEMKDNHASRVYVIVGDGECDEGQIWEAAMSAAHYHLENLVCIVDKNQLQYDGLTDDVHSLGDLEGKFKAFGWAVVSCDGHDVEALYNALCTDHVGYPLAVIASTVKGKGVSFMEGNPMYHNSRIGKDQLAQALAEQELI